MSLPRMRALRALRALPLQARLVVFAVLCALPLLTVCLVQLHGESQRLREHAIGEARQAAERLQMRMSLLLAGAETIGQLMEPLATLEGDGPGCGERLRTVFRAARYVADYAVLAPGGQRRCGGQPAQAGPDPAVEPLLQQALAARRPTLSGHLRSADEGRAVLLLAVPSFDAAGAPRGIGLTALSAERLTDALAPAGSKLALALLDRNGVLVGRSPGQGGPAPGASLAATPLFARIAEAVERPLTVPGLDGRPRLHVARPIRHEGELALWVVSGVDVESLQAQLWQTQLRNLALVLALATAVVLLAMAATRPLVLTRLRSLLAVARRVSQGRYDARVPLVVKDELRPVEMALNQMIQAIERDRAELAARERRYRLLFENSLEGILETRPGGDILAANAAACRMLGHDEETLRRLGREGVVDLTDPRLPLLLAARRRDGHARGELFLRRSDGSRLEVELASVVYTDPQRGELAWMVIRDITLRRQAEQAAWQLQHELELRVRQRTRELETANQELEAFSYTVSHDLRAPVAVVESFSKLLQERGAVTHDKDRHYLARIHAAALHMNELVEGLLLLAHIGRVPLEWTAVDLSALAIEVAQECRDAEPGREVRLHVDPGMSVVADRRLMRVVLANLLSNAWKFTRPLAEPCIRVEMSEGGSGEQVFCVRDNGAGFDEAHAARLFEAFHRLHKPSEFPGLGIGLATVHRILQRHGGRVWAHSRPGAGAAFHFVLGVQDGLPRAQQGQGQEEQARDATCMPALGGPD